MGKTAQHLKPSVAKDTIIKEGKILNTASAADIKTWLESIK